MSDRQIRIAKTGTYGVMHMVVAFAVAFAMTRSWTIALGISLVEPVVQTACYYLHERGWARVHPHPVHTPPCEGGSASLRS